ncbi:MAG: serine/threonine protein kinase [Lentisphaeria bacterium]|nr:serine/threonine protein kinase [Lentisphaeria bacterium]
METPNRNWNMSDPNTENTVVISDENREFDGDDLLATLPLKPQDRYKFIRSIGFGGMKGVLLVHDRDTGRDIAMAIMPDFRDRPIRDLNRFVREARITASLEHPNIVPVYDIGIDALGSPFFTMKYLHGCTLAMILHRLRSGDPETIQDYSQNRLMQVFLRVCNAVAFAHSRNICHFDLKPGNIYCGDFGEVQVIDWGLAGPESDACESGRMKGTPGYMAPELLVTGGKAGKSSDIYALGAILYAILTLDSPCAGLPQQEILRRTAAGKIEPPSLVGQNVSSGLEAICLKAMALRPEDRYANAVELRREIQETLSGYAAKAENASAMRNALLFVRRNIYAVIIFVLLLITGLLTYLVLHFYKQIL